MRKEKWVLWSGVVCVVLGGVGECGGYSSEEDEDGVRVETDSSAQYDDNQEIKFEKCYVDSNTFIRDEVGVIRACLLLEDNPIKKNICKRVVNCAQRMVDDEETISQTGLELRSGDERLEDFDQEHKHYSDKEFSSLVKNTFTFLYESGCAKDVPEQFHQTLPHFMYWFTQQIQMQKCFQLREEKNINRHKFKIWQRRMTNKRRFENEMEFFKAYLQRHKVSKKLGNPEDDVVPVLYSKIIKNEEGRPLGSARYVFMYDKTKVKPSGDDDGGMTFRDGLSVVGKVFDCWDEGNHECEHWEKTVDKHEILTKGPDLITESEFKIFKDLHKYIPDDAPDDKIDIKRKMKKKEKKNKRKEEENYKMAKKKNKKRKEL